MTLRILIATIIVFMFCLSANGQIFHDAENEQIIGHVKSVTYNRSNALETFTFDSEGRIQSKYISHASYDKNGWMTSCIYKYMGHDISMSLEYDSNHRLSCQKLRMDGGFIKEQYTYADGLQVEKYILTVCYNNQEQSITTIYSSYIYDDQGNWTSRACSVGKFNSYESRNIVYW